MQGEMRRGMAANYMRRVGKKIRKGGGSENWENKMRSRGKMERNGKGKRKRTKDSERREGNGREDEQRRGRGVEIDDSKSVKGRWEQKRMRG